MSSERRQRVAKHAKNGAPRQHIVMLGTSEETKGGISAVVKNYRANGLFERWPIVYFATHCDGAWPRKAVAALYAVGRFATLLLLNKVALAHVHSASNASFWRKSMFVMLARAVGRPVIFHLHGGGFEEFYARKCGRLGRALVRSILNAASQIIVVSDTWYKYVSSISPHRRVITVANPIEAEAFLRLDETRRRRNVVLFLGRLDDQKGTIDLVEAVFRARREIPDIKLWFAGEGDMPSIVARAQERQMREALEFLGWVDGQAKARVLAEASVYVLPSYREGSPLAVLEAMAAGLPVIATAVGGIPDVIENDRNGILVPPGDIEALAAALLKMLRDPALCSEMGKISRAKIMARFSTSTTMRQIEALYRTLGADPYPSPSARSARPSLNGETR